MTTETFTPLKGRCTCKTITYEVLAPFLCTNCCHCTWCQPQTGSAFVLNAIIETSNFRITSATKPLHIDTASASGGGQMMARCPNCYVVLYSDYGGDGTWAKFVRVGTLNDEGKRIVKPDVHVWTTTKLDWVDLSGEKERGVPILEAGYRLAQIWRKDAVERYEVLKQKMAAAEQAGEESKT